MKIPKNVKGIDRNTDSFFDIGFVAVNTDSHEGILSQIPI